MMISLFVLFCFLFFEVSGLYMGNFLLLIFFLFLVSGLWVIGMDFIKGDLFFFFGLDGISYLMVLLLLWVVSLVLILFKGYVLNVLMLALVLMMLIVFISLDFLFMYLFFEASMLPMFMIIMFLGTMKERYLAGLYMILYTTLSSLPSLVFAFVFYDYSGSLSFDYLCYNGYLNDFVVFLFIIIMFLVKIPLFIFHMWLPKAHVEAPVFGSMVLASIMLKMGSYGIVRCLGFIDLDLLVKDFFFSLCFVGGLVMSYICLYQVDLKVMVAYSSVIHMGLMMMGLFSGTEVGYVGAMFMMVSHGICSSAMFYWVNEIYKISGSRLLMLNSGLMGVYPILSFFWLLVLINNLGVPPCFGILGELMLIVGCLMYSFYIFFGFFFLMFFLCCFVINMYVLLLGGECQFKFNSVSVGFYYGIVMHLFPLDFFIVLF